MFYDNLMGTEGHFIAGDTLTMSTLHFDDDEQQAELKEAEPSRKQTGTPQDRSARSRRPNTLKPGKSVVEWIGKPDHEGWVRKKSDHYNSWKRWCFIGQHFME